MRSSVKFFKAGIMSNRIISFIGSTLKYLFWKYIRFVLMVIPYCLLNLFVLAMSRIQMWMLKERRLITGQELIKSNLAEFENVDKIVFNTFKNQLMSWIKVGFVSKINASNVNEYLMLVGVGNLESVMYNGKGAILLNPHFGPFLLVLPALGYRGYIVNQVAVQGDPITGKRKGLTKMLYEAQFRAVEDAMPVRFINVAGDTMVMRKILKALNKNESVVFSSTGREGKSWHETIFLGRKATFNIVPFKTALKTGAALLPVFVLGTAHLSKVIIEKPISVGSEELPEKILEKYIDILSDYVKKYPDHFGYFLYDMHLKSGTDIKPLFADYPTRNGTKAQSNIRAVGHP